MRQKTAYELRISDWSSDVCPSDLSGPGAVLLRGFADSSDEVAFAAAPPQFGADAEKGRESDTLEKLPCVPIDTIGKAGIALGIARRRIVDADRCAIRQNDPLPDNERSALAKGNAAVVTADASARQRVVSGKSVSVRVDLGGGGSIT